MPRGDKSAYTEKQKRQAEHIEEGYLSRGVPRNEMTGGGRKSGSGGEGEADGQGGSRVRIPGGAANRLTCRAFDGAT